MNKVLKLLAFAFLFGAQFADAQKNLTTKNVQLSRVMSQ